MNPQCLAWIRKLSLFLLASIPALAQPQSPDLVPRPLEIGKPLERELIGNDKHLYQLPLASGQYLHLIVDQRGIDVVVTLWGPDGKELVEVDSPNGKQGPEPLYWLTESAGNYRVEVRSLEKDAVAGRYEVRIATLQTATELDRKRVAAMIAWADAERLFAKGKPIAYGLAVKQYEIAAPLLHEIGDFSQEAGARFKLGMTHYILGERQQALRNYQQAVQLHHELKERLWEARSLNNLGAIYIDLGELRKAVEAFTKATPLWREEKNRQGEASGLNGLGRAYYDLGEKPQALEAYTKALQLWREEKNRRGEVVSLHGLGTIYRDLGERQKALEYYLLSLQIRRDLKDRAGEAMTLNELAVLYNLLGEVQKMLDTHAQALQLRNDPRGRAITLNNIGRVYDQLGLPEEALRYYHQALPLTRMASDKLWEAQTLNFMGLAYWSLGDYQLARVHLNQALPLFQTVENRAGEAATLNNLGLVYRSLNDFPNALRVYQQALPLARAVKDRQAETSMLGGLGVVYNRLGDNAKAIEYHEHELKLSREIGDRRRIAKAQYGIARVEYGQGKLQSARLRIEQAIQIIESFRAKLDSPELRAAYRASTQEYYDLYVDVLMRLHQQQPHHNLAAEALQVSERARARSLIELLTEVGADIRQGVDAGLIERERALQEEINDKTAKQIKLLSGPHTPEQSIAAAQELEQRAAELRDTQAAIRRSSPRYAALTQPEPLTVRQLQQQLLNSNTMLLEYALGEEHSYLWAVTATTLRSFKLPKRAVIETVARRYYELLTARNQYQPNESLEQEQARIARADAQTRAVGAALSKLLLGPVAAQLGARRLIIVSDGALQYVPFAALPELPLRRDVFRVSSSAFVSSKPETQNAKPLIATHEIVNLPSASVLAVIRREMMGRQIAPKLVAVIADPVFDNNDERVKTGARDVDSKAVAREMEAEKDQAVTKKFSATAPEFSSASATQTARMLMIKSAKATSVARTESHIPRLPDTRREAETILGLVEPAQSLAAFDFAANRVRAMSAELGQYRIIHFATHGFLNSANPELSGLVLSLVDERGAAQNGFLLAPEIYNLRLFATDLVVLSACQTGLGREVRGEGVIGLTRGFMYAGAPRVVVSLWNVSDQATADLMQQFYTAMLRKGLRPAAALRAAQINLWQQRQWRAPYYWAAFGLQGEWR